MIYLQKSWKFSELSPSETKIYQFLRRNGESRYLGIVTKLDIKKSTLKKGIKGLLRKGAVAHLGYGRYKIPDEKDIDRIITYRVKRALEIIRSNPEKYNKAIEIHAYGLNLSFPEHSASIDGVEML